MEYEGQTYQIENLDRLETALSKTIVIICLLYQKDDWPLCKKLLSPELNLDPDKTARLGDPALAIQSMTAFGMGETSSTDYHYRCEIKTLNSRFVDVNLRLPRALNALETDIIATCKRRLKRGKVDVSLDVTAQNVGARLPQLNEDAVRHYQSLANRLQNLAGEKSRHLSIYEYLRLDGVLETHTREAVDDIIKLHRDGVINSLNQALDQVIEGRRKEGQALAKAMKELLQTIGKERQVIASQSETLQSQIYQQYRKRLENLLKNLGETGHSITQQLPDDRLLAEVAILTDKSDIAEELTRLATHEQEFSKTLEQEGEVGRKLDFLCQEMHREINTVSNKLNHSSVTSNTLAIKQTVERLRQQVQNIE
jgi:uncharacterized protein (TIGR00255 family)